MIVADAPAVVEFLLGTPAGDRARARMVEAGTVHAPALVDVEVAQAVRRLAREGTIGASHGKALIEILQAMPIDRRRMDPLLPRIWSLRDHLTAYDAAYVALAEALGCALLTFDERITAAPGLHAEIVRP